jgi:hypothetical protein
MNVKSRWRRRRRIDEELKKAKTKKTKKVRHPG